MTSDFGDLAGRLAALEDKDEIRTLLYRYSRGSDRMEIPLTRSEFYWDDAAVGFGATPTRPGDDPDGGPEREFAANVMSETHHMFGNITIDLRDGHALVESYCVAHHRTHARRASNEIAFGKAWVDELPDADTSCELIIGFRYLDRFEKRNGVWRVAHRRYVFDWSRAAPYSGIDHGGLWDGTPYHAERYPDDQVYHWDPVRAVN
jgi:hypothetical protein